MSRSSDPNYMCFPVDGKIKCVSQDTWDELKGPKPGWGWPNDGCTMAPNQVRRAIVWPACVIHDWHYDKSSGVESRLMADLYFLCNLYIVSVANGANRIKSAYIALVYFYFVRKFGGPFFHRRQS